MCFQEMEESVLLVRLSLYLRLDPILFSLAIAEIWAGAFAPPVGKRDSLPRKGREAVMLHFCYPAAGLGAVPGAQLSSCLRPYFSLKLLAPTPQM